MVMDQAVVDYNYKKQNGRKSLLATQKEVDEMKALQEAWEKKRNGLSYKGKTVNLSEFVKGKI